MTEALQFVGLLTAFAAIVGVTAYVGATAQRVVNHAFHVDLTWWLLLLSAAFFWFLFWGPFSHAAGDCYPRSVLRQKDKSDFIAVLGWGAFLFLGLGAGIAKKDWFSTPAQFLLLVGMLVFGGTLVGMALGSAAVCWPED